MIKYGCQTIDQNDINAVLEVLNSEFLTQGPVVKKFEEKICGFTGAKNAVAVNSATSALHIACLALQVSYGDNVWTSPITFAASSNAALMCGAKVDFVDINPETYNICVQELEKKLEASKKLNQLPKVIIVVHLAGQSADMAEIKALSKKYKFKIIEDASHAIGGTYNSFKVGSCAFSDVTVFSFHPVKIITTAEGGMALTNCAEIAKRMRLFSSHGITRNAELFETKSENFWHYEQLELGYNYRMNELSAALGLSQSKKIDQFVEIRNKLADNYSRELKLTKLHLPKVSQNKISSFHLYIIRLPINVKEKEHRNFMEDLLSCGIGVNLHYMPVYNHPFYQNLGFKKNYCPEAEAYARTAVSLPIHPNLSDEDQEKIIDKTKNALGKL